MPRPKRKPEKMTRAKVNDRMKEYHDRYVAPLHARILLLEKLVATNAVTDPDLQRIDFVDRKARIALNEGFGLALELPKNKVEETDEETDEETQESPAEEEATDV